MDMVMGEPLSMLSTVVAFVQLILTAEATARHNRRKCRDLADRVRILDHLLPGSISASNEPALHRLNAALAEAHALVESCGRRRGFFNLSGRNKAARLEGVERRINGCILDLNLGRQDKLAENIVRQGKLVGRLALDARDLRRGAIAPPDQVHVWALPQARQEMHAAALPHAAALLATATRFSPSTAPLPPAAADRVTATRFAPSVSAWTRESAGFPPRGQAQGHLHTINLEATAATQTTPPAAYSNEAHDPYGTAQNHWSWESRVLAATGRRIQPATVQPASYGNTYTAVPTFSPSIPSSRWGSHLSPSGLPPSSNLVWSSSGQHAAMSYYPSWYRPSVYSVPPPSSRTVRSSLCSSAATSSAFSSTPSDVSASITSSGSSSAPSSLRGSGNRSRISSSSRCASDNSSRFTSYDSQSQYSSDTSSRVSRCSSDISFRYSAC